MVVGAFFSEVGTESIRCMKPFITNMEGVAGLAEFKATQSHKERLQFARKAAAYIFQADSGLGDLACLGDFLYEKKSTILAVFENPSMLENSRFTSMLWALYHVMDEIKNRENLTNLPTADMAHLSKDLQRAFSLLFTEWLLYMEHLREKYPYLFSLAVRKSTFAEKSSVIIHS